MILPTVTAGLRYSVIITLIALAAFGYGKSHFTGLAPWKGAAQTVVIGGVAAAAAFLLARLVAG
jgi:VIT1/CCC1 family predicted Fe2+/Mn2+ transporter